eukprot:1146745-Pelagomonas_calceolata.AAC.1
MTNIIWGQQTLAYSAMPPQRVQLPIYCYSCNEQYLLAYISGEALASLLVKGPFLNARGLWPA